MERARDTVSTTLLREDTSAAPTCVRSDERKRTVDALTAEARSLRHVDYDRLKELAERAFELACQPDETGESYPFGMAAALACLADRSSTVGEWTDSLSQAAQAISLLEAQGPSSVLSDALGTIGWTHFSMGEYADALEHMLEALAVAEEAADLSLQAAMLDRIGSIQASANHADAGLESQQRALSLHRQLGDALGTALVRNNMAYTYLGLGDHASALAAAEAALAYAAASNRRYLLVAVLDTVAEIHLRADRLETAEEYSTKALALARELGSETDKATSLIALGRIAAARHSWDEALEHTSTALELTQRKELSVETFECHRLLSLIYEQKGELISALAHFKAFHELKQQRVNEETESRLGNLRVRHQVETARKDAEIHRLRNLALEREVEERRVAQARLEAKASLDSLTGLYNRGHLELLSKELRARRAGETPISLLMFDIDRFKRVNDTYGHVAGDRVLMAVTKTLRDNARATDVACRYGGDEFLVLLTGMDAADAFKAAERLREVIAESPVSFGEHEIPVTISVGVATSPLQTRVELSDLIVQADRALYAAKQSGRNRVVAERTSPLALPELSGDHPGVSHVPGPTAAVRSESDSASM